METQIYCLNNRNDLLLHLSDVGVIDKVIQPTNFFTVNNKRLHNVLANVTSNFAKCLSDNVIVTC